MSIFVLISRGNLKGFTSLDIFAGIVGLGRLGGRSSGPASIFTSFFGASCLLEMEDFSFSSLIPKALARWLLQHIEILNHLTTT